MRGAKHKLTKPYGVIKVGNKKVRAHRFSWELFVGPIPDGLHVLHRCDNPRCINYDHLFLGTDQDNMSDMIAKGRKRTKLSADDVIAIRQSTQTQKELGKLYGVHHAHISRVKAGKVKMWGAI